MTEILPSIAEPARLSEALRRCGALRDGAVRDVAVESSRATLLSRIIRLRLAYDGDASGAPGSVIVKTGLPERSGGGWNAGRQEVAFYSDVAAVMPPRLVPRCFEAFFDPETTAWHLLLEDLTDSHVTVTTWPLPPTAQQCEHILHVLARVHAAWWDDRRLGVTIGAWLDAGAIAQYLQRFAERYASFSDRLGDRLSPERRALYDQFIDATPRLLGRYHSHRNMSLVHGDAHVWNYLLPRDGGDDVRLFDWDSWRTGVATNDLAYMMATHWYPERRRRLEQPLLDYYHATLVANGVHDYDRRALDDDYRLSVLWQLITPVSQAAIELPPLIWWSHIERIVAAIDDLGCRDLLT
jgi:thiamine kinase-like enzyme